MCGSKQGNCERRLPKVYHGKVLADFTRIISTVNRIIIIHTTNPSYEILALILTLTLALTLALCSLQICLTLEKGLLIRVTRYTCAAMFANADETRTYVKHEQGSRNQAWPPPPPLPPFNAASADECMVKTLTLPSIYPSFYQPIVIISPVCNKTDSDLQGIPPWSLRSRSMPMVASQMISTRNFLQSCHSRCPHRQLIE